MTPSTDLPHPSKLTNFLLVTILTGLCALLIHLSQYFSSTFVVESELKAAASVEIIDYMNNREATITFGIKELLGMIRVKQVVYASLGDGKYKMMLVFNFPNSTTGKVEVIKAVMVSEECLMIPQLRAYVFLDGGSFLRKCDDLVGQFSKKR